MIYKHAEDNKYFMKRKVSHIFGTMKDQYLCFTEMLTKAKVTRSSLYRMIKSGIIRSETKGYTKFYSYSDVINNKPRKK